MLIVLYRIAYDGKEHSRPAFVMDYAGNAASPVLRVFLKAGEQEKVMAEQYSNCKGAILTPVGPDIQVEGSKEGREVGQWRQVRNINY